MKRFLFSIAALLISAATTQAQFGGVVFDPTQSVHAVQQIVQADQLYTTTMQTTQNVIATYNFAKQMASSPRAFISPIFRHPHIGRCLTRLRIPTAIPKGSSIPPTPEGTPRLPTSTPVCHARGSCPITPRSAQRPNNKLPLKGRPRISSIRSQKAISRPWALCGQMRCSGSRTSRRLRTLAIRWIRPSIRTWRPCSG